MVVTGAGPGIMQAAMEGAGREHSIGVAIRLPFEQGANPVIAGDEKYVSDEVLLHPQADAGQGEPGVRLPARRVRHARRDVRAADADADRQGPAGADRAARHARRPVLGDDRRVDPASSSSTRGLVAAGRHAASTSSPTRAEAACAEIDRFYANYHSIRYVGDHLVLRLQHEADRRPARRAQRALRRTSSRAGRIERSASRSTSSAATTTTSSCRASASSSAATAAATCGR